MTVFSLEVLALTGVAVATLVGWLSTWERTDPEPLGWMALAAAARWSVFPQFLMGGLYPDLRAAIATGEAVGPPSYGRGARAIYQPLTTVFGDLHLANAVLSVLTVGAVWQWARNATSDRNVARIAAALAALLPLPVFLGGSESTFVPVALLEVIAVASMRSKPTVAALAAGLAVHTRPQSLLFALVIGTFLVRRRAYRSAALLALLGLARVVPGAFDGSMRAASATGFWAYLEPWRLELVGPGGSLTLLDPMVTPAGLVVAAFLGWREPWETRWYVLAAIVAVVLPSVHFNRPTDTLRMQLVAQSLLCLPAALALVRIPTAGAALAVCTVLLALSPLGPPTPWRIERQLQREVAWTLPASAVVWVPTVQRYKDWTGEADTATHVWRTRYDSWVGDPTQRPPPEAHWVAPAPAPATWRPAGLGACVELVPVNLGRTPPRGLDVEPYRFDPVIVGLYSVDRSDCR